MTIIARTLKAMTMPFTISLATTDAELAEEKMAALVPLVQTELARLEAKFSAFRPHSLVCRFQAGDQTPILDPEFQAVYAQAIQAKRDSHGYFDPYYKGHYDPTGLTKGWIIEQVFERCLMPLLQFPQILGVSLNGAGDLQVASQADGDFSWQVGIENPQDLQKILAAYPMRQGGLATSGLSKRGQHLQILGQADLLQVSILSDSLTWSDTWATALFAAGLEAAQPLIKQFALTGLLVTQDQLYLYQDGQEIDRIHY